MRTQNQNPNYVEARIVSDAEAQAREQRVNGFESMTWLIAVVVTTIGAIQYWTGG